MVQRSLGRTGLSVFPLGLGTVKLGRNQGVKYPNRFDLPSDAEVADLLEVALDEGIVLWDTAPAYGSSEERIGPHLRRQRDRIVLCTKVGEEFDGSSSHHDFSADAIMHSVERSLRRLQTDVIDLLLLHSDGGDLEILDREETMLALEELKRSGRIRATGISAKTEAGVLKAAQVVDVIMAPLGLGHRDLEPSLRRARASGVGVIAIKVLGQGHAVAAKGVSESLETSLRFVLENDGADVALIGTSNGEHLREAARCVRKILSPEPGSNE